MIKNLIIVILCLCCCVAQAQTNTEMPICPIKKMLRTRAYPYQVFLLFKSNVKCASYIEKNKQRLLNLKLSSLTAKRFSRFTARNIGKQIGLFNIDNMLIFIIVPNEKAKMALSPCIRMGSFATIQSSLGENVEVTLIDSYQPREPLIYKQC